MIEKEFVADGKRRFFPVEGTVSDVFLRIGNNDRCQDLGEDYELAHGGVSFPRAPRQGVRVVIHLQDRTRVIREVVTEVVHVERPVVVNSVVHASDADQKLIRNSPELLTTDVVVASPVGQIVPVIADKVAPQSAQPVLEMGPPTTPLVPEPESIDDIKAATVKALRAVADEFSAGLSEQNRVAWNDKLARLAVDVWAAPSHEAAVAARSRALAFIKDVTGQQ